MPSPVEALSGATKSPRDWRAPMVIIVAACPQPSKVVSPFEQQLTAGCAVMAMQMAAVAQGFGGIWRSGWPMTDRGLHEALGFGPQDQMVGFLYLGTPVRPPEPLAEAPALDLSSINLDMGAGDAGGALVDLSTGRAHASAALEREDPDGRRSHDRRFELAPAGLEQRRQVGGRVSVQRHRRGSRDDSARSRR